MDVSTSKIIKESIDKSHCYPETKPNKIYCDKKPRVLICADGGLQAGDLAALLIKDYDVERVMTLPGLLQAMDVPVKALIIIADRAPFCLPGTPQVLPLVQKWKTKVLMFGNSENHSLNTTHPWISNFTEIPNCQIILNELSITSEAENEAR